MIGSTALRWGWAVQLDNAADRMFIAFGFTAAVGLGLHNPDGSRNRR